MAQQLVALNSHSRVKGGPARRAGALREPMSSDYVVGPVTPPPPELGRPSGLTARSPPGADTSAVETRPGPTWGRRRMSEKPHLGHQPSTIASCLADLAAPCIHARHVLARFPSSRVIKLAPRQCKCAVGRGFVFEAMRPIAGGFRERGRPNVLLGALSAALCRSPNPTWGVRHDLGPAARVTRPDRAPT